VRLKVASSPTTSAGCTSMSNPSRVLTCIRAMVAARTLLTMIVASTLRPSSAIMRTVMG
jgi:hypothetical protein